MRKSNAVMVCGAMLFAFPAFAQQRTIVGVWAASAADCGHQMERMTIGAMSIRGHDFLCSFKSVDRRGSVVTWKGSCSSEGKSWPTVVTAKESDDKLIISYSTGVVTSPLVRCPR